MSYNNISRKIDHIFSDLTTSSHEDLENAITDLNNIIGDLQKQKLIAEIIESIALTSDNENVSSLRRELFATVKLIHGDEIDAMYERLGETKSDDYAIQAGSGLTFTSTSLNSNIYLTSTSPSSWDNEKERLISKYFTKRHNINSFRYMNTTSKKSKG